MAKKIAFWKNEEKLVSFSHFTLLLEKYIEIFFASSAIMKIQDSWQNIERQRLFQVGWKTINF